jgi:hypothetical protein
VRVCMCVCACVSALFCASCMHARVFAHMCSCMRKSMGACVCVCTCMCMCVCVRKCANTPGLRGFGGVT